MNKTNLQVVSEKYELCMVPLSFTMSSVESIYGVSHRKVASMLSSKG